MHIMLNVLFIIICLASVDAAILITPEEIAERYHAQIQEGEENTFIFPGNVSCSYEQIIRGLCKANFTCVPEGELVWAFEHCCGGSEPYLEPHRFGQPSCRDVSLEEKISDHLQYNHAVRFIGGSMLILFLAIVSFLYTASRKTADKKR